MLNLVALKPVMSVRSALIIFLFFVVFTRNCFSQSGVQDSSIRIPFIGVSYGLFIPGSDLADRFGNASILGMNALYKTPKNLVFGFSGGFIFGSDVKEDGLLDSISTGSGQIIGLDGLYADVRVFERGYLISATFGKFFTFKSPNPNSGIMVTVSPGFIQHKIRIESIGNTVPQLRHDYKKGYDHLTNGFQLTEFIGYTYFSNRQLVNFYGGFEFIQGFTSNRRDYNFNDTGFKDDKRLDLLYGFKLGWILPLYKKKPAPYYLY